MADGRIPELFDPITLPAGLVLKNRIAMLALTRARAEIDGAPNAMIVESYRQHAAGYGRNSRTLSRSDPDTIYGGLEQGYTDYPVWDPADPAGSVVGLEWAKDAYALLKAEAQV